MTKFGQSCLLIEKDGKKILIDPGSFFSAKHSLEELGSLEAVIYTHQHRDHFDESLVEPLKQAGVPLYGNAAVCALLGGKCHASSGSGFSVGGFDIMPVDIPHFDLPDGSTPPQNTAYVIDGTLIHPGDSNMPKPELKAETVAATIGAPTGEEFAHGTVDFIKQAGANKAIPIHYDHYKFDPQQFAQMAEGIEVIVLEDGQSTEI